jgi:acyl carrier protein
MLVSESCTTHSSSNVSEQLVRYLAAQLAESLDEHTDLIDTGLLDSLLLTDVVVFIQARFGIVLDSEDVTPANFRNATSLSRLIWQRQLEQSTP